jgi:leucyl-tRNA synthetase
MATDGGTPPHRYTAALAREIERRWQERWRLDETFHTPNPSDDDRRAERLYVLDMFPYPSGDALHVGHPLGYIGTDVYARFQRMAGRRVLHPFGFDTFGLPAEQHAIETGEHPAEVTARNVATMRAQLRALGIGHDPRREIVTSDPAYYRWTQWIFLQMFGSWYDVRVGRARQITDLVDEFASGIRREPGGRPWGDLSEVERRRVVDSYRLAYRAEAPVNWCPALGTVLANEEVTAEGRSERGDHPVHVRPLVQWMLRITAYADRLADDLDLVDWPEPIVAMQRNWIGRERRSDGTVTYRLRDWLFSRQRYWGEPFPIVYDEDGLPHPVPEENLPVSLPDLDDFAPRPAPHDTEPVPPLARDGDWVEVVLDLGDGGKRYRRETSTMPQWAGSSWYYLRYLDPDNDEAFVAPDVEHAWMPVDLYVGGVEHAVLHLLYARFWHKVLYDLGHVSTPEPFRRLYNQGYILAPAYVDSRGVHVPADEVERDPDDTFVWRGEEVEARQGKMGKSLKNAVAPDPYVERYGADTFRLHLLASGALDADRPWSEEGIVGAYRFLQRVWRTIVDEDTGETRVIDAPVPDELLRALHHAIATVRADTERLRLNTAIAALMSLVGEIPASNPTPRSLAEPLVLLVAPFAPHVGEELWARLGHETSVVRAPFPEHDPALLTEERVEVPVQVDGRVRARIEVAANADSRTIEAAALGEERVAARLAGREVDRVVVIPGRVVNVVTRPSTRVDGP